ncbi:hypothetical protein F5884DRAFT_722231 [Xylogone sp. PMI_703]|nr:hypothetical protein F5884DRAFT_722231 [Xylogone sp. PMI_703]
MGSCDPGSRVLVTGANGFIAAYCVADLLSKGFEVVGTVRTAEKAKRVLSQHSNHPALRVKLVSDLIDPHAFDEAIEGCTAVLHLASPFGYAYKDFETELLIPSIKGTETICLAASRTPSVKRVVITSSFAAVFDAAAGPSPGRIWTEDDWSPLTYDDGKNAPIAPAAYRASKKLAEKAAWDYIEKEKPQWDLVTLCPGMVFGPLLPGTINGLKELNASNAIIWNLFDAKAVPETRAPLWTSVVTLARAHTLALSKPEASNTRFLVINGDFDNQELADIIHSSKKLSAEVKARIPAGKPGDRLKGKIYTADSSKISRVLGLDLNVPEESLVPTVEALVEQLTQMEKA